MVVQAVRILMQEMGRSIFCKYHKWWFVWSVQCNFLSLWDVFFSSTLKLSILLAVGKAMVCSKKASHLKNTMKWFMQWLFTFTFIRKNNICTSFLTQVSLSGVSGAWFHTGSLHLGNSYKKKQFDIIQKISLKQR